VSALRFAQTGKAVERRGGIRIESAHVAADRRRLPALRRASVRPRVLPTSMITVVAAESSRQREQAMTILYAHVAADVRSQRVHEALDSFDADDPRDIVLLAEHEGKPAGALLARLRPGHTAFVWPPAVTATGTNADPIVDALLAGCCGQLDAAGVVVGQALLELDDRTGQDAFARNGFPFLTRLELLTRSLAKPLPPRCGIAWRKKTYTDADHVRFVKLLEATCVGSLDCAELRDAVTGDDALAVHRASGEFDPRFWWRFEAAGRDVGLVLINPHSDVESCEVNYIGIVPDFRGKGLGRAMLIEALHAARGAGFPESFLAVDEKNHFASRIYRELGFTPRETRVVHLRVLPKPRHP
jgi:GNAT superfamily N-acetyltransferase